ncbi:GNAT family N-acetyltransferase [Nocardia stercoris]|uniref:GNAT family N-acetyltransferase n=1 Tax=Nocardia stercoris TaxID=2483361 RepID=A0A3M2L929_9NOCA|nr:GNAT family N-acetyltransferase [Nocardia stercoris]RMI32425.1 GNAT family N-acetyltransferase [Nocardia stercoris]
MPEATAAQDYSWVDDLAGVDLDELSNLYRIAPLGDKPPQALRTVFYNSRYLCFVYAGDRLVAAGRALADGLDCAYLADIAVHPDHQGKGLGREVIARLIARCRGHKKILLYANPGTEDFYRRQGFLPMKTAMAIWRDPGTAIRNGLLEP